MIRYGSVCSGIEAATAAWHPLGFKPAWFSEIDPFPCWLLNHHYGSGQPLAMPKPVYPEDGTHASICTCDGCALAEEREAAIKAVSSLPRIDAAALDFTIFPRTPNLGDMEQLHERELFQNTTIDLLVGGTPCQSFSVAGLRKGLADPRGNLALVFLSLLDRKRPRWVVWENVPGVLSSNGGRDFGAFLGGLAKLGYGFAYRVLDAQFFGVAQRRRRVFVVGYLGDWRRAAAVLFERASLQGNPPPRREAGQNAPPTLAARTRGGGGLGTDHDLDGGLISAPEISHARMASTSMKHDPSFETYIAHSVFDPNQVTSKTNRSQPKPGLSHALPAQAQAPIAFGIRADAGRSGEAKTPSPDAEGRVRLRDPGFNVCEEHSPTLDAASPHTVARQDPDVSGEITHRLGAKDNGHGALSRGQVRRLTPQECERLQAFPDGYTLVPYRGKPAKDGPRYKALGNTMCVAVMRWIGKRIAIVDQIAPPKTKSS